MRRQRSAGIPRKFSVGEWFGNRFEHLSLADRIRSVEDSKVKVLSGNRRYCPFHDPASPALVCNKQSGICSLQLYQRCDDLLSGIPVSGNAGALRAVCPNRFNEAGLVKEWIGETMLGCRTPRAVSEVRFLKPDASSEWLLDGEEPIEDGNEGVGRIDSVFIHSDLSRLEWCAVEMQAVYFSGKALSEDYDTFTDQNISGTPFPKINRRPDYRSSGPKRLMPQLQIKVPTLRRWGRKMAVVVDEAFFGNLGRMDTVSDMSNADIAWFVVGFDPVGEKARLAARTVHFTTLERAVEGLTAGFPVTKAQFEADILRKLSTV